MKTDTLKNKEGQELTTKEGKKLYQYRLTKGDEFVPQFNTIITNENERETLDTKTNETKKIKITSYTLKCKVRNGETKEAYTDAEGNEEIYIDLTKAQAESLQKKIDAGLELNQNLFHAYEYKSEKYGTQVGVGLRKTRKPKGFDDFDEGDNTPSETPQ